MVSTLNDNDVVLVNRVVYKFSEPKRGDIVVLRYPGDPEKTYYVKRIIGLPGEELKIDREKVFIDGEEIRETYLDKDQTTTPNKKWLIAEDSYFTVGDNRIASSDSRKWGFVEKEFILGRVSTTVYPRFISFAEVLY